MFPNLMVLIKSMNNGHIRTSAENYSNVNCSKALELAIKQTPGDLICLKIKQIDKENF